MGIRGGVQHGSGSSLAWFGHMQRILRLILGAPLGYAWLCSLGMALFLATQSAYHRSLQVEEYAFACDPFGYLVMAQEIRRAVADLELPHFHLESPQTRLLIDLMRSRNLPLPLWDELVAPHAHHYFPQAGYVGVQYPPGTGMTLALFPEGEAVHRLNQTVIWLLLATGITVLIMAGVRGSWITAGFVILALNLGLNILGKIGTMSFSINAMLAPLLVSFLCLSATFGLSPGEGRWHTAWFLSFLGGCFLGFAMLIRLPIIFLVPGLLMLLWPGWSRLSLKQPIIAWNVGMFCSGILPLVIHQSRLTGAWYLPTYSRFDTPPPSLEPLGANLSYYLGLGPGSQWNWALVVLVAGVVGLMVLRTQSQPIGSGVGWRRLLASVLVVWGVPTVYFLTHPVSIPYYSIPATFGATMLLALGAFTIESRAADGKRPIGRGEQGIRWWIALAVVFLPGTLAFGQALSSYARSPNPLPVQARPFALPADLAEAPAWVWADLLSGTFWYYAKKPAFKISFTNTETRALVYHFVFERKEPQYLIRDSPDMQRLMDEISQMGGKLEPRGTVDAHPYFAINWPEGGPRLSR
jgi:hypothetical protein